MKYQHRFKILFRKKSLLIVLLILSVALNTHAASWGDIVITEVLADVKGSESTNGDMNEFVELYNRSADSIDISGWQIGDNDDSNDFIELWDMSVYGKIADVDITTNTTVIPSGYYVVILDQEYSVGYSTSVVGNQPYDFPVNTIIVTVDDTTLLGSISESDVPSVYLKDDSGTAVSSWSLCGIISASDGYSVEMKNYDAHNTPGNWVECSTDTQNGIASGEFSTPGGRNSNYTGGEIEFISPVAISNLTALAGTNDGEIMLKWTAPGDDGTSGSIYGGTYRIKAATYVITQAGFSSISHDPEESYSIDISTTYSIAGLYHSYVLSGLYPGTTYYCAIILDDGAGNWSVWPGTSASINNLSFTYAADLKPPVINNLSATAGDMVVNLSWDEPSPDDIDFYRFYRDSTTPYDFSDAHIFDVGEGNTSYSDTGLANGVRYYYRAETWDKGSSGALYSVALSSGYSNIAWAQSVSSDVSAPVISHSVLTARSLGKDTVNIDFDITDDNTVVSATVTYRGIDDTIEYSTAAALAAGLSSASVSLAIEKTKISDSGLEYYISAYDDVNTARLPVSGWYRVEITEAEPSQKFSTPSNPEVVFGSDAEEVVITDARGYEVFSKKRGSDKFIVWDPSEDGSVKIESGVYIYRAKTSGGDKYGPVIIAK